MRDTLPPLRQPHSIPPKLQLRRLSLISEQSWEGLLARFSLGAAASYAGITNMKGQSYAWPDIGMRHPILWRHLAMNCTHMHQRLSTPRHRMAHP